MPLLISLRICLSDNPATPPVSIPLLDGEKVSRGQVIFQMNGAELPCVTSRSLRRLVSPFRSRYSAAPTRSSSSDAACCCWRCGPRGGAAASWSKCWRSSGTGSAHSPRHGYFLDGNTASAAHRKAPVSVGGGWGPGPCLRARLVGWPLRTFYQRRSRRKVSSVATRPAAHRKAPVGAGGLLNRGLHRRALARGLERDLFDTGSTPFLRWGFLFGNWTRRSRKLVEMLAR